MTVLRLSHGCQHAVVVVVVVVVVVAVVVVAPVCCRGTGEAHPQDVGQAKETPSAPRGDR